MNFDYPEDESQIHSGVLTAWHDEMLAASAKGDAAEAARLEALILANLGPLDEE